MNNTSRSILLAALCVSVSACASHRPTVPEASILPPKPAPRVIGKISLVNKELGFVLVQTAQTPEVGTSLMARSIDGRETAQLKVSSAQKPPFLIADVAKGTPHVGDCVIQ